MQPALVGGIHVYAVLHAKKEWKAGTRGSPPRERPGPAMTPKS